MADNLAGDRAGEGLAHLIALQRHFEDLRDGEHAGQRSRGGKEAEFARALTLLEPVVQHALGEIDQALLLGSGLVTVTTRPRPHPGVSDVGRRWELSWPEQSRRRLPPVTVDAFFGATFHHPHLRGRSVGDWPLNIETETDAWNQLPVLRAIITAELHNIVFLGDYRIVPSLIRTATR